MIQALLNDIEKNIDLIEPTRHYWFVRTNGGEFYNEFRKGGYIAIGYNEVTLLDIANARGQKNANDILGKKVKSIYEEEKRPKYIGNQLIDFAYSIKKNDIVLIPSENSDYLTFGVVLETPTYNELNIPNGSCPFTKRKKVKWFKEVSKFKLDPNIFRTIFVHRTITKIDPSAIQAIDRTLNNIFIKNDETHLVVNINKHNDLNATELFKSWLEIFKLTEEFGKQEGLKISTDEIKTKLNLNSPGTLELISTSIYTISIIALILAILAGANVKIGNKLFTFEVNSDGIIKKISDFLSDGRKRDTVKELNKKLENLEIDQQQLSNLLTQILTGKKDENGSNQTPNQVS